MFRRAGGQGYQPEDRAIYSSFRLPRKKREELATMSSEGPATVMFERDLDASSIWQISVSLRKFAAKSHSKRRK